jgi:predicted esterase
MRVHRCHSAWLALALTASGTAAQEVPSVQPGQVAERVVSPSDTTQSYAVYIPSKYVDSTRWPILFLLDPRGRALVPLERFRDAAERNGWILLSSWNSVSDGPAEPNARAMNAMLSDARASFSLHERRLYIGGFSGTARLAWEFAAQLGSVVAGIFGASASTTPAHSLLSGPPARVAFYGAAGQLDFNHDEVLRFEERLMRWAMPHRIRVFDGTHEWPPAHLAADALDWFDLQAMRSRLIATDSAFVSGQHDKAVIAADSLENAGRWAETLRRRLELASDFEGLRDVGPATARARALESDRRVKQELKRTAALLEEGARRDQRLWDYVARVRAMAQPPRLSDALRELDIARLKREAAGEDTARALAAGRALEQILVAVSFYVPREFLARGDAPRALAMLDIADVIKPGNPQVLIHRARAFVALGHDDDARHAVEAAIQAGVDRQRLRADSVLGRLVRPAGPARL